MLNRLNSFSKLNNNFALIFVILFALILTIASIWLNSTGNILGHSYRDVYLYLIDSLRFSGVEITGYEYVNYLPPLIPFLTSILFRLGFVSQTSIFIVTGIFFFFGILGMYYLLKIRFDNNLSILGAVLYGSLIINLKWVGNGTLDIPSIAILLWALYFFIQGIEKNQKFFYLAFSLGVLCFFGKYTGAFVFGFMALYFASKTNILFNIKKYFKGIFKGVIIGVLTAIPFLSYFILNNIPFGFINQAKEVSSRISPTATTGGKLIGNDLFFYIKGLIYDIGSTNYIIGVIILAIGIIGIIIVIYNLQKTIKNNYSKIKSSKVKFFKLNISFKLIYCFLFVSIVLIAISFFTASLFSFVYSEGICFLGMFLFVYTLSKIITKSENVNQISESTYPFLSLNITMFAVFFAYLVFFSAHLTKADRYFTVMAPGFVYLLTLGFDFLIKTVKTPKLKIFLPLTLILILLFSAGSFLTENRYDSLVTDEKNTYNWVVNNVDDYSSKIIFADRGPIYTWYFQKEVFYIKDSYTPQELNQKLLDNNVSYYLRLGSELNLTDYSSVEKFGKTTVYKRD